MKMKKFLIYTVAIVLAVIVINFAIDKLPDFISEATTAVSLQNAENHTESVNTKPETTHNKIQSTPDLILVNSEHSFKSVPNDLVCILDNKTSSYYVKDRNVLVQKKIMKPLNDMMDAFYKETGLKTVNVISGYRSIESQEEIYKRNVKTHGADYAKKFVQKPGYSEHHTGLAIDLALYYKNDGSSGDFTGEGKYSWFYENSWKYGFVRRYDESKQDITGIGYEPWHFRYVGKNNAKHMYKNNLCLEEYVNR